MRRVGASFIPDGSAVCRRPFRGTRFWDHAKQAGSICPCAYIAIIAHVDHGKTTLIDVLLKQSGSFRGERRVEERAMDSNDIERERGFHHLAKVTSLMWKDTAFNIVDTPATPTSAARWSASSPWSMAW